MIRTPFVAKSAMRCPFAKGGFVVYHIETSPQDWLTLVQGILNSIFITKGALAKSVVLLSQCGAPGYDSQVGEHYSAYQTYTQMLHVWNIYLHVTQKGKIYIHGAYGT